MTPKEQISATGAQLFAREKMLERYIQQKDTSSFRTQADILCKDALKLVDSYPDYLHGYVVYYHIVSNISEKFVGFQNNGDEIHAVELLAYSLHKLTAFIYPDALKNENATNLCMDNALRLFYEVAELCDKYDGNMELYHLSLNILRSIYNKALRFHPNNSTIKTAREVLQAVNADMTSNQYAMSKDEIVKGCLRIYKEAAILPVRDDDFISHLLNNYDIADVTAQMLNKLPQETAPGTANRKNTAGPPPIKAAPPAAKPPQYHSSSYSSPAKPKPSFWRRFNDTIIDIGDWFEDNVKSVTMLCTDILEVILIVAVIAAVIIVWIKKGFFLAALIAVGGILLGEFYGIISWLISMAVVYFIMYLFRFLFLNAWTLMASIIVTGMLITFDAFTSVEILGDQKSRIPEEYVTPATQTYCCTASSVLNVRSAPESDAKVIGTIKSGEFIQVNNIVDGYDRFKYGETDRYASLKYLKKVESTE